MVSLIRSYDFFNIFSPDGRVGFNQPEDKVWDREEYGDGDDDEAEKWTKGPEGGCSHLLLPSRHVRKQVWWDYTCVKCFVCSQAMGVSQVIVRTAHNSFPVSDVRGFKVKLVVCKLVWFMNRVQISSWEKLIPRLQLSLVNWGTTDQFLLIVRLGLSDTT